ncbi:MAG: type VI secretion system baseplate subunit TssK [Polyangiaceae bacterium]
MTESLRKPIWPPSGKLRPQHRQFPDAYGEQFALHCIGGVSPYGWGLSRFAVADDVLARGIFQVNEMEGRFFSGAPIVLEGSPLARPLPVDRGSVRVSVAVARPSYDAPNVTEDPQDAAAVRYRRVRRGDRTGLRPQLRLLFDDEGGDAYERIALGRVSLRGSRAALDPWFVPPMTRLLPRSAVNAGMREIVAALLARRGALLAAREARPLDLRALPPEGLSPLLLLSAINQALAILDHPDPARHLSPAGLHGIISALLGALEAIEGRVQTPGTFYTHDNPGPSFRPIFERLLELIPEVARDPHMAFPLTRIDAWTFSLALREPEIFRRRVFLVASGADESALATLLPAYAKIGSAERLPMIVNSATRGVPIALEFDPPGSLPSSASHCSFRVDTRSAYWSEILETRSLLVHVPEAPPGLTLMAYVLTAEAR